MRGLAAKRRERRVLIIALAHPLDVRGFPDSGAKAGGRCLLRCMSPELARLGPREMSDLSPKRDAKRTLLRPHSRGAPVQMRRKPKFAPFGSQPTVSRR